MKPTPAINPNFAVEMLRSPAVVKLLHAYSHGVVDDRLRLYPDAFGQIPVSLPPLDEQRRIAEVLRSVDEAIAVGEAAARQAFEVLKQTMVASLHLKAGEVISEEGWQTARLGNLGKVQAGRQRAPSFTKGELRPYLRVANVFDGFIDTSDVLEMPFTERECHEYILLPGDILLNEGQSIELVGRAAMYLGDPSDCCFQNTLVRFRASVVPASFAYALIRTLFWTGRLSEIASRTTSVAHLGVSRLADMRVALPPANEQLRIGELFNDLCAAHESHRMANDRLRDTRRSIIDDLLTGRVRVPA
jgi:type I restriction enzyme S subunit